MNTYGFMVQVFGGLITYLLLAIYCHKHFQEKVSINRVRELRINIQNGARILDNYPPTLSGRRITLMQKPNRTLLELTSINYPFYEINISLQRL
jgi:hypothetical protein